MFKASLDAYDERNVRCSQRSRLPTESYDEDGQSTKPAPKKKSKLMQRTVLAGAALVVFVLFNQMMPGGVLSDTAIGQGIQALVRKVANVVASVSS